MRWRGRRQSENVEDRRSMRGPAVVGGGAMGIVGIVVILAFLCLGGDPRALIQLLQNNPAVQPAGPGQPGAPEDNPVENERAEFVSVVLADTEDVWTEQFQNAGLTYRKPKLVLFRDRVKSACGFQSAATGPFYCPEDEQVYIDLSFFDEMSRQFGAPGDFAEAYVIAHEVGHHVQKQRGINQEVHDLQRRVNEQQANELSVRLELQADFLAGVWAHHAERNWGILEAGDVEEALDAAAAVGDDRMQMRARGYTVPESFQHGTSQQRARWFLRGLRTGDMNQGNTFSVPYDEL